MAHVHSSRESGFKILGESETNKNITRSLITVRQNLNLFRNPQLENTFSIIGRDMVLKIDELFFAK